MSLWLFYRSNLVHFLLKRCSTYSVFDNFLRGTITNINEELKNSEFAFSNNNDLRDFNSMLKPVKKLIFFTWHPYAWLIVKKNQGWFLICCQVHII